jgi:hypothetical protein
MNEEQQPNEVPPPDPGLRRLLTYTFIALAVSLVLAFLAVTLAIRFFDTG